MIQAVLSPQQTKLLSKQCCDGASSVASVSRSIMVMAAGSSWRFAMVGSKKIAR